MQFDFPKIDAEQMCVDGLRNTMDRLSRLIAVYWEQLSPVDFQSLLQIFATEKNSGTMFSLAQTFLKKQCPKINHHTQFTHFDADSTRLANAGTLRKALDAARQQGRTALALPQPAESTLPDLLDRQPAGLVSKRRATFTCLLLAIVKNVDSQLSPEDGVKIVLEKLSAIYVGDQRELRDWQNDVHFVDFCKKVLGDTEEINWSKIYGEIHKMLLANGQKLGQIRLNTRRAIGGRGGDDSRQTSSMPTDSTVVRANFRKS